MQLRIDQLSAQTQKPLLPIYLVSGDEPLQVMEAMDILRLAARKQGFATREILTVNKEFSWDQLNGAANSMSLFAEQRVLELRIDGGGPGKEGGQALVEYVARPADDAVLLIQMGKIDKRSQSAKWYKAIDAIGAISQIWPIKLAALPQWLQQRMRSRGLEVDRDALSLLAARVEGNLLAAAQEVEKLVLLYGSDGKVTLSLRQVTDAVANSARYSVYDLVDVACSGALAHSIKILNGLQQEGVAPTLVLWALTNEIRNLYGMASRVAAGEHEQKVLYSVWENRKNAGCRGITAASAGILGYTPALMCGSRSGCERCPSGPAVGYAAATSDGAGGRSIYDCGRVASQDYCLDSL